MLGRRRNLLRPSCIRDCTRTRTRVTASRGVCFMRLGEDDQGGSEGDLKESAPPVDEWGGECGVNKGVRLQCEGVNVLLVVASWYHSNGMRGLDSMRGVAHPCTVHSRVMWSLFVAVVRTV